jgi:hypothetical protein
MIHETDMKNYKKSFGNVLMALLGGATSCEACEEGEKDSGITGACTWMLTGAPGDYTLTISGNGAMEDYDYENDSPWIRFRDHIKTAVIQDGITTIGNYSFYDCNGLTSVTIPNSVTTIGEYAFCWCSGLISVIIPDSITTIGWAAFRYCYNLTSVTIGNSVTSIGASAFDYCSALTALTIGKSVTTVAGNAFDGCRSLTTVTNLHPVPQNIHFVNTDLSAGTLKAPASAVDAYKNARIWREFGKIVAIVINEDEEQSLALPGSL